MAEEQPKCDLANEIRPMTRSTLFRTNDADADAAAAVVAGVVGKNKSLGSVLMKSNNSTEANVVGRVRPAVGIRRKECR